MQVNESEGAGLVSKNGKKNRKGSHSLQELYEKKREEQEKARMEREAFFKARAEQKAKAESHRKDLREKMFKKTRKGQPVMKYRIEHILETLQGSTS
ncbi:rRNA-processing protein FYV7 [Bienertia sinuspersici]